MSERNFQAEYDAVRDKSGRLFQRNPGAYSQLSKYGKEAVRIRREADAAGQPVIRRPKGWTK